MVCSGEWLFLGKTSWTWTCCHFFLGIKGEKLSKIRGKNPNKQNFQSQASMSHHRSGVCSLCGSQHGSKAEHERLEMHKSDQLQLQLFSFP